MKISNRILSFLNVGILILTSFLIPTVSPLAYAAFPGVNGKIIFVSNRTGNSQIFSMNPDGSGQTNLSNNTSADSNPEISADSTKIVFESTRAGNDHIFVMNADGSSQMQLTNGSVSDSQPDWSPDGTKITFVSDRSQPGDCNSVGHCEIYTMNADGTGVTRITFTSSPTIETSPHWSPDGTKITFVRGTPFGAQDVWVMNATGGGEMQLTNFGSAFNGIARGLDWSPDGTKLTFSRSGGGATGDVWVMNADGTNQINLTNTPSFEDNLPAWSPDGTKITFESNRDTIVNDQIYTMNPDGSGVTRVTSNSAEESAPDWGSQQVVSATTLTYTGTTTQDFKDPATLSAHLADSSNNPVVGATINFTMASESCSGVTDASGNASCTITPSEAAGTYTVTASYPGDKSHQPSSDSKPFTVTLEETTTTYTGPTNIAQGQPVTAVLKEDNTTGISGRTVTLSLATGENCSGTTDGTGNVSCTLSGYPLGPNTITASFAGDAFYKASSDSKPVLIFANLSSGSFVLGDVTVSTATSTTDVEWWGAQWVKLNTLSVGSAPNAFKGFADTLSSSPATCGGTWTTDPGNSSTPPANVPTFMSVIVSSSISKSGSLISGDIPKIVIVKTDPGYANDPGHAGTGTIVATLCGN